MEKGLPIGNDTFKRALAKKVKMIFGTDGGAGAHGRNFEELVYRVRDGGQPPMAAIVSATSLSAESLRMQDQIGSIATRHGGRHHRDLRQSARRHHVGPPGRLRDERRDRVQERRHEALGTIPWSADESTRRQPCVSSIFEHLGTIDEHVFDTIMS